MTLDFAGAVSDAFAFLNDAGFTRVEASPQRVRYCKGELEAVVFWGYRSGEVSFRIGYGCERYSTAELIRLMDRHLADEIRNDTARDQAALSRSLARLADLIWVYGQGALSGDQSVFTVLKQQRRAWSENFAQQVLARQLRPKAEDAFRRRDYAEAARLYEQIESQLSAVELKKLAIAQERSRTQN